MSTISLGRHAQLAALPSHLCVFHESYAELRARQRDFLGLALNDRNEGALLFGAPGLPEQQMRDLEVDLGRSLDDDVRIGKLVLIHSDPDPDVCLERYRGALEALDQRGYAPVRAIGRCTWSLPGFPLPEDQLWLELRVGELIESSRAILLCAYDLATLPASAVVYGGFEAHSQIVLAGQLIDNPSFIGSDRYFVDRLLHLPWLAAS